MRRDVYLKSRWLLRSYPAFNALLNRPAICSTNLSHRNTLIMAAVYKRLSKSTTKKDTIVSGNVKHRQRVLILSSRGVNYRQRHLLNDLYSLLPHSRKDAKLDTKTKLYQLNELAELYNCNNVMFFEARKSKDLYIWMTKAPNGPTVKTHVQNRKSG